VFFPVYAALAIAAIFYLGIPLVGAFALRSQWRRFRLRLAELSRAPILSYRDIAVARASGERIVGRFRLYGRVEALEGADRAWLRGEGVSALVDFSRSPLYVLPSDEEGARNVARLPWTSVTSLAEGTPLFTAGLLVVDGDNPVFVEEPGESLVAVSYDCGENEIAPRLVEGGRAVNEYWTPITQVSIALGLAAMSVLMVVYAGKTTFSTLRAMTFFIGVLPILSLVPPGLLLYLAYRALWRRAWSLRSMRDAFRMPLSFFAEGRMGEAATLPGGGRYVARRIAEDADIPADALVLDAIGDSDRWGESWLFAAEGGTDPAAITVVTRGDPAKLAAAAARGATVYALLACAALAAGLAMNYILGVLLWQALL